MMEVDLHFDENGPVYVAMDISSFPGRVYIEEFCSEMKAILKEFRVPKVVVIQCDHRITDVEEFDEFPDYIWYKDARGGTLYNPVFERIEEMEAPSVLFYHTDLVHTDVSKQPDYPVVWVTLHDFYQEPPFGDTLQISNPRVG